MRLPVHKRGEVAGFTLVDDNIDEKVRAARWCLHSGGYAHGRVNGVPVYLHRLVAGLSSNAPGLVHHVNHDPLDNRRSNLQICETAAEHLALHPRSPRKRTTEHGREITYRRGCRCGLCKERRRVYQLDYRRRLRRAA